MIKKKMWQMMGLYTYDTKTNFENSKSYLPSARVV